MVFLSIAKASWIYIILLLVCFKFGREVFSEVISFIKKKNDENFNNEIKTGDQLAMIIER